MRSEELVSRIPHAKNQLLKTKTVTCRADTVKQTDRQTEIVKTERPIEFFWVKFVRDFFFDERSNSLIKR